MKRQRGRKQQSQGWALVTADDEPTGACPPPSKRAPGRPVARLRLEKRRGRAVTVCNLDGAAEKGALGRELRAACGTGGTAKGQEIELQGDHRERLRTVLVGKGFRVKG